MCGHLQHTFPLIRVGAPAAGHTSADTSIFTKLRRDRLGGIAYAYKGDTCRFVWDQHECRRTGAYLGSIAQGQSCVLQDDESWCDSITPFANDLKGKGRACQRIFRVTMPTASTWTNGHASYTVIEYLDRWCQTRSTFHPNTEGRWARNLHRSVLRRNTKSQTSSMVTRCAPRVTLSTLHIWNDNHGITSFSIGGILAARSRVVAAPSMVKRLDGCVRRYISGATIHVVSRSGCGTRRDRIPVDMHHRMPWEAVVCSNRNSPLSTESV